MKSESPVQAEKGGGTPGHVTSLPFVISPEIKAGKVLAGDDFSQEQLETWLAQEAEAYFEVDDGNSEVDPWYAYMHYVNEKLGFSKLGLASKPTGSVLVLGPGPGTELDQFASANPSWTFYFLEASANFRTALRRKWPGCFVIDPVPSGDIRLPAQSQDIVCAFSVLHHIANVSKVVGEAARVVKPGGWFLVREPCSSMGDWRYPRSATPNERGISRTLLVEMARRAGFVLPDAPVPILFEPINKVLRRTIGYSAIPTQLIYYFDRVLSWSLVPNDRYWRDSWYKKLGPSSYFYRFQKPLTTGNG